MRYKQQFDSSDCGAACFCMIASYFGLNISIAEIRNYAGTDRNGSSIQGLVNCGKHYNLKSRVFYGDKNSLNSNIYTPFIAHLYIENGVRSINHYVIIKKISTNYIYIWDPDVIQKKKKMRKEDFLKQWSGFSVFFEPDINFQKTKRNNLLIKFLPIFLPHKTVLLFSFISSILLLLFGITISFYYKYLFDEIIYSKIDFSLHSISFAALLLIIFQTIITTIRSSLLSHFSFKTDLTLNFSYISHIMKLPISFFETRKVGEIISRLGDLEKIKASLSSTFISGTMDILMIFVSGPILYKINKKLFFLSSICSLLLAFLSFIFAKIYKYYYSVSMNQNAEVQTFLHESINGITTVKSMNAELIINDRYETKKMEAVNTGWKVNKFKISQSFSNTLITGVCGILIYWIGSYSIINNTMSFGTLLAFNSLLVYFTGPINRLLNMQNSLQEAFVAAERVGEILELETEKNVDNLTELKRINGEIQFSNVTFSYGAKESLFDKLNLYIKQNQCCAFVGPSGSGKSTIAKMLLKFYEPVDGQIYIDGININEINTYSLRNRIGYVAQDIFLFSGTIADNISLHKPDATIDEIIDVAKKTKAHDFINKLPNKYNTLLGEHGCGLSGGEKQRLVLARALLGKPDFLILDEATSNLDTLSEMEIHDVINQLREDGISVILIAHRLTTVVNCDTIYVFNEGKIIQEGNHKDLIKVEGLYKNLWTKTSMNE